MNDSIQKIGSDVISIDKELLANTHNNFLITISSVATEGCVKNSESCIYRITPDGKIMTKNMDEIREENGTLFEVRNEDRRQIIINRLVEMGYEEIPEDLSEVELKDVLEFTKDKLDFEKGSGKIYPFRVEPLENRKLKIILIIWNGSDNVLSLTKFPFKLKDASDSVIFKDLVDLNKTVTWKKVGIAVLEIESKDWLESDSIDLTKWSVTFELH